MAQRGDPSGEATLVLTEERLALRREVIATGQVKVEVATDTIDQPVRETLRGERVEVERVTIGRDIDAVPPVRDEEDGAVTIIPVVEEVLVLTRQLVLREEIRIRRIPTEDLVERTVQLRRQSVAVTRSPASADTRTHQARDDRAPGDDP